MTILTLDFETYFDDDYTLSKMTTEAYVRDSRFELHGVGLRTEDGATIWVAEPERGPKGFSSSFDWPNTTVLAHHAAFDGLILSHHFGVIPGAWRDTFSMASYLFPNQPRSLEALTKRFGLSPKSVPYAGIKGVHYASMPRETQRALADGCLHDCELTYTIYNRMMNGDY